MKEWQDHVLAFGWAYGPGGTALRGKTLLSAITTGGPESAYTPEGMHGTTVRALLAPIAQTARLCGMSYHPPLVDAMRLLGTPAHAANRAGRLFGTTTRAGTTRDCGLRCSATRRPLRMPRRDPPPSYIARPRKVRPPQLPSRRRASRMMSATVSGRVRRVAADWIAAGIEPPGSVHTR